MTFWGDERAQPVQIGFILLLAMLVLAFSSYQAFAVPQQNERVEFQHSQTVDNEFAEFRSSVVNAVGSDDERSGGITLGTQYPPRLIALNPPPVSGSIRTTQARPVTIEDGTGSGRNICGSGATSRSLVYRTGYNEYQELEAVSFENTFVAREFRSSNRFGDQRLVDADANEIDLLLLNGSISDEGVGSVGIDVTATHRYSESVTDPNITLPSRFSASEWESDILSGVDEVNGVSQAGTGLVTIDFGGTFTVSCAVAGLDTEPAFQPPTPSTSSNGVYSITWQTDHSSEVPDSDSTVRVQVTDSAGNPLDRVSVDFATADRSVANFTEDNSKTVTDELGIATTTMDVGSLGETEVFAAAGDAVVSVPVEIVTLSQTQADNVTVTSASSTGQGKPSSIKFTLLNNGLTEATIDEISVDDTDATAISVNLSSGPELEQTAGGNGSLNSEIQIGSTQQQQLDDEATIAAGGTGEFTLGKFVDGDDNEVTMNNKITNITLVFSDGSSAQYELDT